jgi:HEAT repeat protein
VAHRALIRYYLDGDAYGWHQRREQQCRRGKAAVVERGCHREYAQEEEQMDAKTDHVGWTLIVCVILGSLLLGCGLADYVTIGATATPTHTAVPMPTPTETPVPTPTPIPTPTVPPVLAVGWEDESISSLCLRTELAFPGEVEDEIIDCVRGIVAGLGLEILADEGVCDATLSVELTGEALGAPYIGKPYCWSGAAVAGEIVLSDHGGEPVVFPVEERKEPPGSIPSWGCAERASDAPFDELWPAALFGGLVELWGPDVLAKAAAVEPGAAKQELVAGGLESLPVLVDMLEDHDATVRMVATWALQEVGPTGRPAVGALVRATMDEDEDVSWEAQCALEEITGHKPEEYSRFPFVHWATWWNEEEFPRFLDSLEAEVASTRARAAFALGAGRKMSVDAVPALIEALSDQDEEVRQAVAQALEDITGGDFGVDQGAWEQWWPDGAVADLTESLRSPDPEVRSEAVSMLGCIGLEALEAVPALIDAMADEPETNLRQRMSYVLEHITGQDFDEDAEAWREWWEGQQ